MIRSIKKIVVLLSALAIIMTVVPATQTPVLAAIDSSTADKAIKAFNNAFLVQSDGSTFYKRALNNNKPEDNWRLALDIQVMLDVYERTGNEADKKLVNDLLTTFLKNNPPPYHWDGWNDDIAWIGLVLVRGYQMTGNTNFLTVATNCFNYVYDRGWDTTYNGGGIWEQQPSYTPAGGEIIKEALSNNPTGMLGLMIYQSTNDKYYLDKSKQIYEWSVSHLFDSTTGQVYRGIYMDNTLSKSPAVYNQGAFIEFSALLYKITGDKSFLANAEKATDYTISNLTNNGILSNTASYLDTWQAEFARGIGHLCKWNPQLWSKYYSFMKKNADAAWDSRRTDLNITWNGWTSKTPINESGKGTQYASAVVMIQFTPPIKPETTSPPADITASSSETGNAPINAFDGNANTRWTASDGTYPQWWKIDLGSVKAVEGMKIKWFESANRYYKYKIETSTNNVNFTTVVDKTSNSVFGDTTDSFFEKTRYIRVTVTGTLGSGWASAYDFEVQFPKITASSSEEGVSPNNAIDGNASTRWAASSVAYPQWLELNLGSVKEIKGLDIKWYNSAGRAYKYKIETSTDNVQFTTVVDKTSNSVFGDTSNSFSANARYVRITITGCSESGGWASINEVIVK